MANETPSKVKIISELFIRPNCEVKKSKQIHYLSINDVFHLSTTYMHRGLVYNKLASSNVNVFIDNLKKSMALALVDFYPLAGRLSTTKYEEDHASWVHVDCHKGPGARLIHASAEESKLAVSDIVFSYESIPRHLISSLFDAGDQGVVNHDGHNRALLSIQVTDLVDGVFIGFSMNHVIADGASLWLFINTLSKISMGQENNMIKPIFKTVLEDGYGPVVKIPYLGPNEFITRLDPDLRLKLRIFHFSAESITSLKAQAQAQHDHSPISSFQALSAFIWLSVARARNVPLESDMGCLLITDTRPRYDPALPSNQFGNFVHVLRVTSKKKDLIINGSSWAALLLNQVVSGLNDKVIRADFKARNELPQVAQLKKLSSMYGNNPPLTFTGSMKFDAYGPEFGLGKTVTTRSGYPTWMDGRVITDPGKDAGSADIQVCLLSETMTALESDNEFMSYIKR